MSPGSAVHALAGAADLLAGSPSRKHVYRVFDSAGFVRTVEAPSLEQALETLRRAEAYGDQAPDLGWLLGAAVALGAALWRGPAHREVVRATERGTMG